MKVFLTSRAFLILSLLWLSCIPAFAFFQNSSARVKTKYEFTDPRISEADTLLKEREYEEALKAYQKAYDIYESEGFYEGMVYAKERMGRTFRSLGKDSLSNITFQAAAALSREKLGPNHILESKAYLNNGIRAHRKQSFSKATLFLDSATWAYGMSESINHQIYRSLVDYKYYTYFYSGRSNDTLIKYLGERERLHEQNGMSNEQRVLLFSDYCRAFYSKGDYQKSIAYGIEAVRRSEEYLDTMNPFYYSDALYNLARSLTSQKEYRKGLDVIEKLLEFTSRRFPDNPEFLSYLNLKAVTLNGLKRYEEAAEEFLVILDKLENEGNIKSRFYRDAVMNLGVCYELMGNYGKSKILLARALEEEKEFNDSYFDPSFSLRYRYLGKLYSSQEDYGKAIYYYDSALRRVVRGA